MATVSQILQRKGHNVHTIPPDASVFDALTLMAQTDVGALVVMDGDRLAGIFSERDYARKVVLVGRASRETPVSDIMSPDVVTVSPGESVTRCMELMTTHRFRHLPVLDGGALVGIISIGDVVKEIITEQQVMISHLEGYIHG